MCALLALTGCGADKSEANGGETSSESALSGPAIKIGFLDPSLAPDATSSVPAGAKAAVEYVNTEMGGIGGRPIELVTCTNDNSAEKGLACGNEFAGSGVVAVVDGFNLTSAGAALPVLDSAGIPLIGAVAGSATVNASPTSYYIGTDQAAFAIAPLLAFKEQSAKRVVLALPEAPTSHTYVDSFLTPIAEKFGLDFSATYYDFAGPNFDSVAATAKAEGADVGGVVSMRDEGQCTQMVQAFVNTGFEGAVLAGACTEFIEAMGEAAAGAQVYSSIWMPQMSKYAPAEVQTRLADAENLLEKYNDGTPAGYYGYATFNTVVTLATALEDAGLSEYTPRNVADTMKGLKDAPTFLGPSITCDGSVWPNSSSCTDEIIVAEVQEDGSVKPLFDPFLMVSPDQLPG